MNGSEIKCKYAVFVKSNTMDVTITDINDDECSLFLKAQNAVR